MQPSPSAARFGFSPTLAFAQHAGRTAVTAGDARTSVEVDEGLAALLIALTRPMTIAEVARALGVDEAAAQTYVAGLCTAEILVEMPAAGSADGDVEQAARHLSTLAALAEAIALDIAAVGPVAGDWIRDDLDAEVGAELRVLIGRLLRIQNTIGQRQPAFVDDHVARARARVPIPRLHIGCGPYKLDGWYNIDLWPADVPLNLARDLPFADGTVEAVYLSHLFEHLYPLTDGAHLLRELHRVLTVGGTARIVVPDARHYMQAYVNDDDAFFAEQRRVFHWWAPQMRTRLEAIGEYLGAAPAPGRFGGHRCSYDAPTLTRALRDAGFERIAVSSFNGSALPELRIDHHSLVTSAQAAGRHFSLFIEATKTRTTAQEEPHDAR